MSSSTVVSAALAVLLTATVAGCALTGGASRPLGSHPLGGQPLGSHTAGASADGILSDPPRSPEPSEPGGPSLGLGHGPSLGPSGVGTPHPDGTRRSSATATDVSAGTPLPACRYADKPALADPDTDPTTVVLDTIYRLPSDFVPDHLVGVAKAGLRGGGQVAARVIDDLRDMSEAARDQDAALAVVSAYRSYDDQVATFDSWVAQLGEKAARRTSARPGHSEHQLGTALDFRSANDETAPWDLDDWATTPAGAWLGANAWRFGFVMSYPKGMSDETCYAYEPWHYRWVGRDIAAQVHASDHTLRRYLWQTYGPGSGA